LSATPIRTRRARTRLKTTRSREQQPICFAHLRPWPEIRQWYGWVVLFSSAGTTAPVPQPATGARIFLVTWGARDLQGKSLWLAGMGPEKFSRVRGFPMTYAVRVRFCHPSVRDRPVDHAVRRRASDAGVRVPLCADRVPPNLPRIFLTHAARRVDQLNPAERPAHRPRRGPHSPVRATRATSPQDRLRSARRPPSPRRPRAARDRPWRCGPGGESSAFAACVG
jgi:hypothetical protein